MLVLCYAGDHALVFWPGEDCVNAVPMAKITTPCPAARGDTCTVVFSKQTHTGVVVEIGKYLHTWVRMWDMSRFVMITLLSLHSDKTLFFGAYKLLVTHLSCDLD